MTIEQQEKIISAENMTNEQRRIEIVSILRNGVIRRSRSSSETVFQLDIPKQKSVHGQAKNTFTI